MSTTALEPEEAVVERERPLASYGVLMATFSTVFGGAIAVAGARGKLPERPSVMDIALVAIAGHRVSRLVARDKVASPLRAPFVETRLDQDGDLVEEPNGTGVRKAVGQLVTCPKCVGQWACAAFVVGMIYSPRPTRAVASVFASDAISDFLTSPTAQPPTAPERCDPSFSQCFSTTA